MRLQLSGKSMDLASMQQTVHTTVASEYQSLKIKKRKKLKGILKLDFPILFNINLFMQKFRSHTQG